MLRISLSLLSALLTSILLSTAVSGVEPTFKNEEYDTKHERNVLDFWRAESSKPTPVVVYFHGGGFVQGDKGQIPSRAIIKKYLDFIRNKQRILCERPLDWCLWNHYIIAFDLFGELFVLDFVSNITICNFQTLW